MKIKDEIFKWEGFGNGFGKWESRCRIRVWEHDDKNIVVATELEDNPGTSITNCAEYLAVLVINAFELDMKKIVWIEHYTHKPAPKKGLFGPEDQETFNSVDFEITGSPDPLNPRRIRAQFVKPNWKRLKKEHVESLVGEKLED